MANAETTAAPAQAQAKEPLRIGLWLTVISLVGLTALLTWRGYDFYRQGLENRPTHIDYRRLNPAGFLGHGYGMVGTAMIVTNLLYLIRRRWAKHFPDWMGTIKAWLNLHVFTGLVGSLLVLFHSAFQLRTPIATITSLSLAIVVGTGFIGLYLFALVPKEALKALKERLAQIEPLLPGVVKKVDEAMKGMPVTVLPYDASFVKMILTVPRWVYEAAARRRRVRKAARSDKLFRAFHMTRPELARAFLSNLEIVASSEVDAHAAGAMMRSWRSLHRFLALLMLVSVSVHIGVAWYYGFRWIFE